MSHRAPGARQCVDGSRREDVTMSDRDWQVEQFERHRPHLHAVAYRMLGSMTEADDALQEAWFRLERSDLDAVQNVPGWLTTVVSRVCLDMLRARRARREDYAGTWLPEPVVRLDEGSDPAEQAVLADAVGLALLVVLETLEPAERLAFVLHDMFGVPFDEIAPMVDRSPEATRQLASRARRRVRGAAPAPDPDLARQRTVVEAYFAAAREGDLDALVAVLDPDVVARSHGRTGVFELRGAENVARAAMTGRRFASFVRPALVNGAAGAVAFDVEDTPFAILAFTVVDDR